MLVGLHVDVWMCLGMFLHVHAHAYVREAYVCSFMRWSTVLIYSQLDDCRLCKYITDYCSCVSAVYLYYDCWLFP